MRKITLKPETSRKGSNIFSNQDIVKMYEDGLPIVTIVKKTGKVLGNIYQILHKEGVEINRKKDARKEQERLHAIMVVLKKEGLTVREIGKKFKMSNGNVCNILYNI